MPPPTSQPDHPDSMSDDEADNIVVAMAGPRGPLGDSFEVENAAKSRQQTPRSQRSTTRPRKLTTNSPSTAATSPAPSSANAHSPSPSTTSTINTPTETDTSNTTATAAQNSRLLRSKKMLCVAWKIDMATLDRTFGGYTENVALLRDLYAKLQRLVQATGASFTATCTEMDCARQDRTSSTSNGDAMADGSKGVGGSKWAWMPSDVDRAMKAIKKKKASPSTASKKRTASHVGARDEGESRPPPAQREKASAASLAAVDSHAGAVQPVDAPNGLGDSTWSEGHHTPTQEPEPFSERASVPRASSVEEMLEAQRNRELHARLQPQCQPQLGSTRITTQGPLISSVPINGNSEPKEADTSKATRASIEHTNDAAAHSVASKAAWIPPKPTLKGAANTGLDGAMEKPIQPRAGVAHACSKLDSEALKCIVKAEDMPPSVFNHILQKFCSLSASHLAIPAITTTATAPLPYASFLLENYSSIILPFFIENQWNLATLDMEPKSMTIYSPTIQQDSIETAVASFLTASLGVSNPQSWSRTYIPLTPPTNHWDEAVVCLVAAAHIVAGLIVPHQDPEPALWRNVLAVFIRSESGLPREFPHDHEEDHQEKNTGTPSTLLISPPLNPLHLRAYFWNFSCSLLSERGRHNARITAAQRRVSTARHANMLLNKLISRSELGRQLEAYNSCVAKLSTAIERMSDTVATWAQLGNASFASALREMRACLDGAKYMRALSEASIVGLDRVFRGSASILEVVEFMVGKEEQRVATLEDGWRDVGNCIRDGQRMLAEAFGVEGGKVDRTAGDGEAQAGDDEAKAGRVVVNGLG